MQDPEDSPARPYIHRRELSTHPPPPIRPRLRHPAIYGHPGSLLDAQSTPHPGHAPDKHVRARNTLRESTSDALPLFQITAAHQQPWEALVSRRYDQSHDITRGLNASYRGLSSEHVNGRNAKQDKSWQVARSYNTRRLHTHP